jgi:eukaryotic-like serine/threonine-protein kinase
VRTPTSAPQIPGYDAVRRIGSGGYADVFLYQQHSPRRQVAVKVMTPPEGGMKLSGDLFVKEANLMAQVSSHPYIAQIFGAGVSGDGRPYLVMEYYPNGNLQERARNEQMGVDEVLRTGIQVASAIETAHRAGILHRDIKPANILISAYGEPGLTDFGIASGHDRDEGTDGVSIPWAPPEAIAGERTDARSDVYSLAATVYTLLEGRSPFEIPGGDNSELALMGRVERDPVPAITHPGAPASLSRVLANAMAKSPESRPRTAAELARALQSVESELRFSPTKLWLISESPVDRSRRDDADDDATRAKSITEIEAQPQPLIDSVGSAKSSSQPLPGRERSGLLAPPEVEATVHRPEAADEADLEAGAEERHAKKLYLAAAAVAAVLVVIISLVLFGGDSAKTTDDGAASKVDIYEVNDGLDGPVAVSPPAVDTITASDNGDGTYKYTWSEPLPGLTYAVTPDGSTVSEQIDVASYDTTARCIQVEAIGDSGLISAPTIGCVDR